MRQLEVLAKKAGIKNLATLAQQFGIDLTSALRQLNTRCITARAHEDAVAQRYENDRKYIRQLLSKNTEMLPKYVRDNHELLRALIPNEKAKISKEDQDLVIVPRGLGVLPGTHAVLKCGYHYNIFSGLARCCPPTHYDLTVDSAIGKAGRFPAILNQGGTESCVAQAFSSASNFARRVQGLPDQTPARSFIWSWTRQIGSSGHAFDGGAHKYLGNWGCSMNIAGDLVGTQGAPSEESDYGCKWYSDMKSHADADNTMTRYDSAALSAAAHGETDVASGISFIHQSDTNSLTANVNAIRYALYGGYPVSEFREM